jgi:hypothetical protein
MSRRVISSVRQGTGGEEVDTYAARVIKYIPADVVAAWITVSSLLASPPATGAAANTAASTQDQTILWVVFVVFVLLTAIWTWRTTHVPGAPVAKTQILISTISFVVWVFGLGGPFTSWEFVRQKPSIGGVVLIVWTLIAGNLIPPKSEGQPPAQGQPPAPPAP